MHHLWSAAILLVLVCIDSALTSSCEKLQGEDSYGCLCTADKCLTLPSDEVVHGRANIITTSRDGGRLDASSEPIYKGCHCKDGNASVEIKININEQRQKIIGFGGSFTDSTVINIKSLSKPLQKIVVGLYFSDAKYSVLRIPLGVTDFSTKAYSYDDHPGDTKLKHFKLKSNDSVKIKLIKKAQDVSGRDLKLLASAWSAPGWMKTDGQIFGGGSIKEEYFPTFASYQTKFVEKYFEADLKFWGITNGNEPFTGAVSNKFTGANLTLFTSILRRTLTKAGFSDTKLYAHDDLPDYFSKELVEKLKEYVAETYPAIAGSFVPATGAYKVLKDLSGVVDGVGLHPYVSADGIATAVKIIRKIKDFEILCTEFSTGLGTGPRLGSWGHAEEVVLRMMQAMNNWVSAWFDWNMVLDIEGGPTWVNNNLDAPMLVLDHDTVIIQPAWFIMFHFSKYIETGSVSIAVDIKESTGVYAAAFLTLRKNLITVVIYNKNEFAKSVTIRVGQAYVFVHIAAKSITTCQLKHEK